MPLQVHAIKQDHTGIPPCRKKSKRFMMMERRAIRFICFVLLAFLVRVYAQDQSGFISIDCGMPDKSSYTDETTKLVYVSDENYIDVGESKSISPLYSNGVAKQLIYVRSFPQGLRNCYTLVPPKITGRRRYFVRATFLYGDYDNMGKPPVFDIYLGVGYWATVKPLYFVPVIKEILHDPSSNYTDVCLVNTGNGTPFISVLELRLVNDNIYTTPNKSSLALYGHWDLRSYDDRSIIRNGDDIFDRIWEPSFFKSRNMEISTTLTIKDNKYILPSIVMRNAVTPQNASDSLDFYWQPFNPEAKYYIYMHFADFQYRQIRKFNVTLNGIEYSSEPITPIYLTTDTLYTKAPMSRSWFNFSFIKTFDSVLAPMINAIEMYTQQDFLDTQTNEQDVGAIRSIKFTYRVKKNWQGDPCIPVANLWLGLNCFNDSSGIPRISSLNLSYSRLTGIISPSMEILDQLKYLDLSNNKLTGEVPQFFSAMRNLAVLNLSGNNFTGTIPAGLTARSNDRSLQLSIEGSPLLCRSGACPPPPSPITVPSPKKSSMLLPIIAAIAAIVVFFIALAIARFCIIRRKKQHPEQVSSIIASNVSTGANMDREEGQISTKRQNYTYAEVVQMTTNFERELGKGGFGSVFHGSIENKQVAVKMLSPSSAQGYKQFKAEAELLMMVYHRNLTTLVGYCDEGDKLGLIYEFMANGDLETHLSDESLKCLSWELRLEIAVDAAHGLEYLHNGCKPPIIHRDIKTTNILLNNEMQAKLADFGLSKAFPADGGHVSTAFAGTPGYFDPEFNMNETSDVYSFGVVLLEVLTGKPPIARTKERTHLSKWVGKTLEINGDIREVVDRRLGNDFDSNSAWKLVDVAMECAAPASSERPTMNQVVIELKRCLEMEKARLEKESQNETNYESNEYNNTLNIEIPGMTPAAR